MPRPAGHADGLQGSNRPFVAGTAGMPVEDEGEGNVFQQRQFRQQVVSLEDEPDPSPSNEGQSIVVESCQIDVLKHDSATCRPGDSTEHVQQGAFPGAGRPDDGNKLALGDSQVNAANRCHAGGITASLKGFSQRFGSQDRHERGFLRAGMHGSKQTSPGGMPGKTRQAGQGCEVLSTLQADPDD
jgi:hypothetical protein